jgi:hypothetical protein
VTGDYAIEDQECVGRLVRSRRDLYAVRVVARRILDPQERVAALERLESLTPRTTARAAVAPPSIPMDPWVASLAGAISYCRRAVEKATPRTAGWASALTALGKAYLGRAATGDAADLPRARLAFENAADTFVDLGLTSEAAAAAFGLGNCDRLIAKTPAELNGVLKWYVQALQQQSKEEEPLAWAETTVAVGEVCAEIFALTADAGAREQAEAAYQRVLAAFASNPVFTQFGTQGIDHAMGRAIAGLQRLDLADLPVPLLPPGFNERETHGNVLFLRPLTTARAVRLENRFTHPERFAVRFDPEPARVTLETVLYRALAEHLSFWSIAGGSDGTGASRLFVLGGDGWKDLALSQFDRADVILFVPSDSAGVRWEIETLLAKSLMTKVLFVMPPAAPDYDVDGLWNSARRALSAHTIAAPDWNPSGLFFAVDATGRVDFTLPFETVWENALYSGIAGRFGLSIGR